MEKLGQNNIYSQFLGDKAILRTYKGTDLINEYVPLYTPPVDWSDIRTDCPANSIALYAGVKSDYSQYDNLGFTATCVGGYKVYIDGTQYGSTYASGTQCNITWSNYTATAGESITTPSALTAHKIWIEPATEGNNITAFRCRRVAASGAEEQGVLWAHFNILNGISLNGGFGSFQNYYNRQLKAVTAKNNVIKVNAVEQLFLNANNITHIPTLDFQNIEMTFYGMLWNMYGEIDVTFKNAKPNSLQYFASGSHVRSIKGYIDFSKVTIFSGAFNGAFKIKELPDFNFSTPLIGGGENFIADTTLLKKDVNLDLRNSPNLNKIITIRSNAFKGLRVSNEAPFNHATPPQINVSYTGMDRTALVQLFNDLPYNVGYEVVGSPTINNGVVSGFSANDFVKTSASLNNTEEDWEMVIDATTTSLVDSGLGNFFGNSSGIGTIGISVNYNQKLSAYIFASNNERLLNGTVGARTYSSGVNYLWNISQKKTNNNVFNFIVKSSDDGGQTWITEYDVNSTYPIRTSAPIYFGSVGNSSFATQYFRGNINLNNTYIKVNDVYWFRGQAAMTKTLSCVGCTGNKLIAVGSPTIVDEVASGFSSSNYFSIGTFAPTTPWEAVFRVKTPDTPGARYFLGNLGYGLVVGSTAATNKVGMKLFCSSNGTSWNLANIAAVGQLELDTFYYIRFGFSGTEYYIEYSSDGITYTGRSVSNSTTNIISSNLLIGIGYGSNYYWTNEVDLNNSYVKVNGETWFDINNCLLPEDKAIATNKGWSLTTT